MTLSVGSCFATHITNWVKEKYISTNLRKENEAFQFFNLESGNIYTVSQLLQILRWSAGEEPPELVWFGTDGLIDPFFQTETFGTYEELQDKRAYFIESAKALLNASTHVIVTLGLTEQWLANGFSVIAAPGTIFPLETAPTCEFQNLTRSEVEQDLFQCIKLMREVFKIEKFTITLSPVPLTATATSSHILTANSRSKSILRTSIEQLTKTESDIAYFPSYEIITNHRYSKEFFDKNMRQVNALGVDTVMSNFFKSMGLSVSEPKYHGGNLDDRCLEVYLENHKNNALPANDQIFSISDLPVFLIGNSHIPKVASHVKSNDEQICSIASGIFWRTVAWQATEFLSNSKNTKDDKIDKLNGFINAIPEESSIIFGDFLATHYELYYFRQFLSKELYKLDMNDTTDFQTMAAKLQIHTQTILKFLIKPWEAKLNFLLYLIREKKCSIQLFNTPYCHSFIDNEFGREFYQSDKIVYSKAFFDLTQRFLETAFTQFVEKYLQNKSEIVFIGKISPFVSLQEQINFLSDSKFDYIHGNDKYYAGIASKIAANMAVDTTTL